MFFITACIHLVSKFLPYYLGSLIYFQIATYRLGEDCSDGAALVFKLEGPTNKMDTQGWWKLVMSDQL